MRGLGPDPMTDPDDTRWHTIIHTNLTGAYLCSKQALRVMKDGEHGRIINLSSVLGSLACPATPRTAPPSTDHRLDEGPRARSGVTRITVNAICPTWVDTDMARQGIAETAAVLGVSAEEFPAPGGQGDPDSAHGRSLGSRRPGRVPRFSASRRHYRSGVEHLRRCDSRRRWLSASAVAAAWFCLTPLACGLYNANRGVESSAEEIPSKFSGLVRP